MSAEGLQRIGVLICSTPYDEYETVEALVISIKMTVRHPQRRCNSKQGSNRHPNSKRHKHLSRIIPSRWAKKAKSFITADPQRSSTTPREGIGLRLLQYRLQINKAGLSARSSRRK